MTYQQPVYLKYTADGADSGAVARTFDKKLRVGGFRFEGEAQWRTRFGYVPLSKPSQFRTLLCKCGANNWSDNGRFINEYECQCCGAFVEATEWRDENGRAEVL